MSLWDSFKKWVLSWSAVDGTNDRELVYYRRQIATWTGVFLLIGLLLGYFFGRHPTTVLMWALACFGVGAGVGFLFGIPKTAQRPPTPPDTAAPDVSASPPPPPLTGATPETPLAQPRGRDEYRQYVNTNLEEISDWLTKIIVGLTLVQYREIVAAFRDASTAFANGLRDCKPEETDCDFGRYLAFAQALIVYFSVLGFLCSYLITRLFLGPAFYLGEVSRLKQDVEELKLKVGTGDGGPEPGASPPPPPAA